MIDNMWFDNLAKVIFFNAFVKKIVCYGHWCHIPYG